MKNKKVSIIVPIYNVEEYLDKCVESLINQTYDNLEIILVDDGSRDGSGILCDKWAGKDARITVIHKENGGLSSARNAGMETASGDYIMFEDSDDWVELELVEKCVKKINREKSDLVIFGYRKVDEKGNNLGEFTFGDETYSKELVVKDLKKRIGEMSFGYAWNKLYDLKILKNSGLKNDSSIIDREDLVFNMQLLSHLKRISFLEYVGYNYLQRTTSLLHSGSLERIKGINTFCEKMAGVKLDNEDVEKKVYSMNVLHYLADCFIKNILWNNELGKKEKIACMKQIISGLTRKDLLIEDGDNPKYLQILYDGIVNDNMKPFYRYVKMSDIKRKILG